MTNAKISALQGKRVLVVEDDYLIGQFVAGVLQSAGAEVIGPAGAVGLALKLLEDNAVDAAMLDVNLHGDRSYAVAEALVARGIGFVFVTGYGSESLDARYRSYPRCEKPIQEAALLAALAAVLG